MADRHEPLGPGLGPFSADTDWLIDLELGMQRHLQQLAIDDPQPGGYCGCLPCIVREALLFTIPRTLDAAAAGLVERT